MSETNSFGNSTNNQLSRPKARPSVVVAIICGLLVILSFGTGLWLGRRDLSRTVSNAATQPMPAASIEGAAREAETNRHIERASRQILMLDKERALLDLELNESILRKMAKVELELGDGPVGSSQQWDEKKRQLQRLTEKRLQLVLETTSLQNQHDALAHRSSSSTTLEIEAQVRSDPRYLELAHYADNAARQVDELKSQAKPDEAALEVAERRNTAAAVRLVAVRDELRATLSDAIRDQIEDKLSATTAEIARIDSDVRTIGQELAVFGQRMQDWLVLSEREKHMRQKLDIVGDQITELRIFDLNGIAAPRAIAMNDGSNSH
jgi:hypothetical protein